ncbi:MAG: lipase family protein [Gammaproteobacteria bacterium]|nr:lipase family protein [Gammaproteobacteria bacterium]
MNNNNFRMTICLGVMTLLAGCFGMSSSTKTENCPTYQPSIAYQMAQLSAASYDSDDANLNNTLNNLGMTLDPNRIKNSGTGTQGLLAYNNDMVVLAFRGTEDFKDWLGNAKIWENEIKSGPACDQTAKVHHGFTEAVDSVTSDGKLFARIAELQNSGRKFYVTGHSLGGALANLAAYMASGQSGIKIDGVYTFGQPPVGDSGFKKCYEDRLLESTFRFVNHKDLVPRLKPNNNAEHVGLLLFLDSDGNLSTEKQKGLLNTAKNVLDTALVESHSMAEYLTDLDKHRSTNPFACQ